MRNLYFDLMDKQTKTSLIVWSILAAMCLIFVIWDVIGFTRKWIRDDKFSTLVDIVGPSVILICLFI